MHHQFSSMITGSKNKHESDVPIFNINSIITQYYSERTNLLQQLSIQVPLEPTTALPELTLAILRKMEKHFIRHGKVRMEKEPVLQGLTDSQWLQLTVLLARYLLDEFEEKSDWNSLNSAVRLSEFLLKQLNNGMPPPVGLAALLILELQIIQRIETGNYD